MVRNADDVKDLTKVSMSFIPSLHCNNSCSFCMYNASPENNTTLDYDLVKGFMKTVCWDKVCGWGLYGGEPSIEMELYLELKIGGDLDNKKARSEKEAILEQYAILSNTLPSSVDIRIFFATAYNRFGEGKAWKQERVRQFFAQEELLIGKDFWDFVCKSDSGYSTVLTAYRENAHLIKSALDEIRALYLGDK